MSEFKLPEEFVKKSRGLLIQRVRTATSIGMLVMQFNKFEHDLGEFLAVFMKKSGQEEYFENIAIMSAALSFGQKLDLLSALYLKRYQKHHAQCEVFKKMMSQLSKFEEYRNALVHSRWGIHSFGDAEFKRFKTNIKGRKGLRQVAALANWRQIRMMCDEMQGFGNFEMFEIYSGCSSYEVMSEKTIKELNERLTSRSNGLLATAIA